MSPLALSFGTTRARDACGTVSITNTDATTPGTCANEYTVTRTFTATDACGNTTTASQVITVTDNTPPVFTFVPPAETIECPLTPSFGTPTATDACGTVSITNTDATTPGTFANEYTVTRTFTATDACGNTTTAIQVITVTDNTPPVFTFVPPAETIECPLTPSFGTPTATDACGTVSITNSDATTPGTCANEYTVTRTFTATDACGNTTTAIQVITVTDNTPPVFTFVPPAETIECPLTPSFGTPTATDACGTVSITNSDATTPGTCANEYTVTRTFTATDACGNTTTAIQVITVTDNTPPVFTFVPPAETIECPLTPSFGTPTATDACGTVSITNSDATTPGTCANEYTVTRTFTATDACGNTTTAIQVITVTDNTPPVFTFVPPAETIECPLTPSFGTPTATDACGTVSITNSDATTPGTCANEYTVTRTFTATDACGNTTTAIQVITVTDNTPPVFTFVPPAETIECPLTPSFGTPTATDACGTVSITNSDATTPGTCANEYTVTRTFTATDACGNTTTASQVITVTDNTPPVFTFVPPAETIECPLTPSFGTPTATDACGTVSITNTDATTPGTCANEYTVTRTFTATDACGNTTTASQVITVTDNTPPVFTFVPPAETIECPLTPSFGTPTATDACGTVSITNTDATTPGTCANEYTVTRTFTATDACGNTTTASQVITVTDNTPPVFTFVPPAETIECPLTPSFGTPTATDACGTVSITNTDATTPGTCANEYTVTRTFTATDACGNTTTASQVITVTDNTPPVFTFVPPAETIECPLTPSFGTPTATDACGTVSITNSDATTPGTCANEYTVTRTFTATDACGNTTTAIQVITVTDNTPPVFTFVPPAETIECPLTPSFGTPTATDACGTVSITNSDATTPGTCANEYTVTRTFTATDACGNTTTASQVITVTDNTPPVFTFVPPAETIECPLTPSFGTPTATDACGTVSITNTDATTPGTCANEYTVTRTFTATDACGNTTTASQVITVTDNTPPVFTFVPPAETIECPLTPSFGTPTATDACGTVSITNTDATTPGTCANEYTVTRTFTATDACGNTTTASQVITVTDNTPPVFTFVPPAETIECPLTPSFGTPTATDACGTVSITNTDATTPGTCANEYTVTRTFTATDACGNTTTASQVITVTDNTPPVFTFVPPAETIECPLTPSFGTPTATDACGTVSITNSDATTPGTCANEYTVTRTFTATDACGNTTTAIQVITVTDNTPPVFTFVPPAETIECPLTPSFGTPTATDACGTVSITNSDATTPGTCANEYTVTRTFTATDACGNTTTASQVITVTDNTPPVFTFVPPAETIECPLTPSFGTPTATDACGTVSITNTDATTPGTCANEYTVTRTFTATDACGNTTTASQVITVTDNTPPVFTFVPPAETIECPLTPSFGTPTATDACGTVSITNTDATTPGTCANEYTVTRTFTATDACGNTTTASQVITVTDNTPPVFTFVPPAETIECPLTPSFGTPTATDACGTVSITNTDATTPGTCANEYTVTRTFTATDACGNTTTASQVITVTDNTPPVFTFVPPAETIECPLTPSFGTPTATDACGTVSITNSDATTPGTCANEYTVTRTFTATDACGNTTTAIQVITVTDNTPPVFTFVPPAETIECPLTPSFGTPTATDACGTVSITNSDATTPGTCANEYTVTRTFTATDACGNTTTAIQVITVTDNTPPVFTFVPPAETIECPLTPSFGTPTATDACGTVSINNTNATTPGTCANEYTVTRTFTATDACGNTTTASQVITVTDNTPPVFTFVPPAETIECPLTPSFGTPTATDACGTVSINNTDATTPDTCANDYAVTRTFTATDACG